MILLDSQGALVMVNRAAERLLGVELQSTLGAPAVEALQAYLDAEFLRQAFRQPTLTQRQFERTTAPQWVEVVSAPLVETHQRVEGWLLTLRDISAQKHAEEQREEVFHTFLHDLRSPVGTIFSSLQFIRDELAQFPEVDIDTLTGLIDLVLANADHLLENINRLRLIESMNAAEMLTRTPVLLTDVLQLAVQPLADDMAKANITFAVDVSPDLPLVFADSQILVQVLGSLLHNAFGFTPDGGTIRVSAQAMPLEDTVLMQVEDSGAGVLSEEREQIFQMFWSSHQRLPLRGARGAGLGLTFCRRAVELHDGRIWLAEHGSLSGACLCFMLPIVSDGDKSHPKVMTL
jgi:PAS domain S-box-containing protein